MCKLFVDTIAAGAEPDTTPRLRIEPGMHFAPIRRIDVDAAERFVVSASWDKTARVWDLRSGKLLQVLRPPQGDGNEGKQFAVAISPDGEQVAIAGWTSKSGYDKVIYIFDRATEIHYREAIARNPAIAQAYFGLGQIYQQQDQTPQALDWYQQAVERAPQNRRFILNQASVYAEHGELKQAETHYRKALALDNSLLLAYIELIHVLLRQDKKGEAQEFSHAAQQGLAAHAGWKDKPLNSQEWIVTQDGKPFYLQSWKQKQDYMRAWFDLTEQ